MPQKPQRRLAAIFVLDVAGFSRMMAEDESGTLDRVLAQQREVIAPLIRDHGGRVIKLMGDGVLAVFPSVISAVEAAAAIQAHATQLPQGPRLPVRIGINLGEVIVTGGDVYGDGVNIAVRLEGLARPGGVALSAAAYEQVRNKIPYAFEDFGLHEVKNLPDPVQVYFLGDELTSLPSLRRSRERPRRERPPRRRFRPARWAAAAVLLAALAAAGWLGATRAGWLPFAADSNTAPAQAGLPVIAVLPFSAPQGSSLSGGTAAGLAASVAAGLAARPGLLVIAPHSSFALADLPPGQAARQLSASHVVLGQLAVADGWSLALTVLPEGERPGAAFGIPARPQPDLAAVLQAAEGDILAVLGLPPGPAGAGGAAPAPAAARSVRADGAYEQLLAARGLLLAGRPGAARDAVGKALALDASLAAARELAAVLDGAAFTGPVAGLAARLAAAAQAAGPQPQTPAGAVLQAMAAAFGGRLDDGLQMARDAEARFGADADGQLALAWLQHFAGNGAAAAEALARALRLNPLAPATYKAVEAEIHFAAHRDAEALEAAAAALAADPDLQRSRLLQCAVLANGGRFHEAEAALAALLQREPGLAMAQAAAAFPYRDPSVRGRLLTGLRLAGLGGGS